MNNKTDLRVLKTRENIKTSFINLLLIKDFKDLQTDKWEIINVKVDEKLDTILEWINNHHKKKCHSARANRAKQQ